MLKETCKRRTWRRLATFGVAGVSVAALAAWAADSSTAENGLMTFPNVRVLSVPSALTNAEAAHGDSLSGFKAYIDPETGRRVRPTHEAKAALNSAARPHARPQAAQPPMTFTGADGSVGMHRDESRMPYLVARRNADGTLTMACVPSERAATAWLEKESDGVITRRERKGELK